jgi:hypothetical protein
MMLKILLTIAIATAVCFINKIWKFDPDAGGYHPNIKDKAQYPKFYVHSVSACLATIGMIRYGIHPVVALGLIAAFGTMYEFSQGFVNFLDILADITGGVVAFLLMK